LRLPCSHRSDRLSKDPRSPATRRHHVSESSLQKALKGAVRSQGVDQRVSCHTLRHCFATHLLEDLTARGENVMAALEQVREYLGHANIRTTMVYLHLTQKAKARDR